MRDADQGATQIVGPRMPGQVSLRAFPQPSATVVPRCRHALRNAWKPPSESPRQNHRNACDALGRVVTARRSTLIPTTCG